MKTAVLTGVRQIEVTNDRSVPEPGPGETQVRVNCVGLNRLDFLCFDGSIGVDYPHVLGADVAGEVVSCGSGAFAAGERVLLNPALPQDPGTRWNAQRECEYVRIFGAHVDGGLTATIVVPDEQLYRIPNWLSDEAAASIPLDYLTAWRMLSSKASISADDDVLVWGAAGPLGCAAISICSHFGARAIAVGSRETDIGPLTTLGASAFVNYTAETFVGEIEALTDGRGPSVVFESVGSKTWPQSLQLVKQGGRIVICGTTSGAAGVTDLEELYYKQVSVFGSRMGYPAEFEQMLEALERRTLRPPPVAKAFTLAETQDALEYLDRRTAPGKVVVKL